MELANSANSPLYLKVSSTGVRTVFSNILRIVFLNIWKRNPERLYKDYVEEENEKSFHVLSTSSVVIEIANIYRTF